MMDARGIVWTLLIGCSLIAALPLSSAHASGPSSVPVGANAVPPPVVGNVTNCTSQTACGYTFSNAHGTGFANSTHLMTIRLPGEALTSYNLSFTSSTMKITNNYPTYIYWTVGQFLGTDVNSGHIIYGSTSTNYSATCHPAYRWCHYTYATDNGTIVVHFTNAEPTATGLGCSPSWLHPQQKTTCTVTVTNLWNASNYPPGKVHLNAGGPSYGSFSNKGSCPLVNGSCTFTFHVSDNACGLIIISATYAGSAAYYKSSGETSIDVYVSGGC